MPQFLSEVPRAWSQLFTRGYSRREFEQLRRRVDLAYESEAVFPPAEFIFKALELVRPEETRVVILGQDPYPAIGKAHGLSFSVVAPQKPPASLKNIFRELERSIRGWTSPRDGNLEPWGRQGVLLLNTILTVRSGEPMSHAGYGWETFTKAVLAHVQREAPFVVFLLWGTKAIELAAPLVDVSKHKILSWSHPSPLAQNRLPVGLRFVGNGHFVETNKALHSRGCSPIDWRL